jgi:hypothetical protein
MTVTGDFNYDRWRFRQVGDGYEIRKESVSLSNALLLPIKPFNLVDAAQQVTPVTDLWTFKNGSASLLAVVPFNETQAYYYDVVNSGDDCMILRNCFRRLYTITGGTVMSTSTIQSQVKTGSNVEVAILCRKNGTSHTYRFFPQHSGINTCFLDGSRIYRRNGVEFAANDSAYVRCASTSVESRYNVIHPEEVDPLASLWMRHTITAQKIAVEVEVDFLQETQIDVGYSIMSNTTLTPKSAAVGIGRNITPVTLTGANQVAPGEGRITSCAMGQTGDSTVFIADWSNNLRSVLASQAFSSPTVTQWFVASTSKYYNTPFWQAVIPAGQSFAWKGEFRMSEWASLFS